MLCQKIIETLEARYPGSCAMDWDNVGLLVGRRKKEVHRIYVAVDATDEVIRGSNRSTGRYACDASSDDIFRNETNKRRCFIGRRVLRLIQKI